MTTFKLPGSIVSTQWLAAHINHPKLVVLDASLQSVVNTNINQRNENIALQIPGTKLFDFEKRICDQASVLPHMMPTPELFTQEVRALGVCQDSIIVIFDRMGVYSSPRAWWMFKAMGHKQVAVLNGGMLAWIDSGMTCEIGGNQLPVSSGNFIAQPPHPKLFCDAEHVMVALTDKQYVVFDARSEKRFLGLESEPRSGLRSGHMPNAINLPFKTVQDGYGMRTNEELTGIFASRANRQQKLIFSCGSGVTACILALAAEIVGYPEIAVYDGSWSEWGLPSTWPVVTG
jgi:thiosulfate/3-mercaptopyruvate sulfurtransferase